MTLAYMKILVFICYRYVVPSANDNHGLFLEKMYKSINIIWDLSIDG